MDGWMDGWMDGGWVVLELNRGRSELCAGRTGWRERDGGAYPAIFEA